MRYGLLENIASFLLFFVIRHDFPKAINSAYTASLNNSDEIKNIFSHADVNKSATDFDLKGMYRNVSLAEGGLTDVKVLSLSHTSTIKQLGPNLSNSTGNVFNSSEVVERQDMPYPTNVSNSKINNLNFSTYKTLQETKLDGTGSNLFLGVPEVIHINGTSSIKPRKGVNFDIFNKIVPPKEIGNENKEIFLSNYSCLWLNENDCYNTEESLGFECSCCKEGNALAEMFKQQALVNCSRCKPIVANQESGQDKMMCKSICCKSVFHESNSLSTTHDNFVKIRNNSKLKPAVTKVPYDIEVVTELLSKVKQKVFLPLVISLLLLPLIVISVFFIWQRTKEYWDKRFYKRMDFLIDGMYND